MRNSKKARVAGLEWTEEGEGEKVWLERRILHFWEVLSKWVI